MHTLSSAAPPLILAAAGLTPDDAISEPSTRAVIKPMDARIASPLHIGVSSFGLNGQLNRETDE